MKQIETTTITVPLAKIKTGPYQQRKAFNVTELRGLAQTIKSEGLMTPPLVMAVNGHYELVAGDRRRRALFALALEGNGLSLDEAVTAVCGPTVDHLPERFEVLHRVEVKVSLSRESDPKALRTLATIENLQRVDLSPVEKAEGFRSLLDDGLDAAEVCERTGERWDSIKKYLLLLEMPAEVRERFNTKALPMGVVREMSELPAEVQVEVAAKMTGRKAREIEAVVKRVKGKLAMRGEALTPALSPWEREEEREPAPPQKPLSVREQLAGAKALITSLTMQIHLDGKLLAECGEALSECNPESRLALMAKARSAQIERAIKQRAQKPTAMRVERGLKVERFIEKRHRVAR
ncbi:MAG: ParB N-terminal domain-containing protein [Anaerolineae bacterium]|nr:ParB N-terminal domain-containing protein [Anaerolineae bacterium]